MALPTLLIVLAAAAIHAFWNLVIARARDTQATTALALGIGVLVALPFAVLRWNVQPQAWPFICASAALELAYLLLLVAAYQRAEMSLVYPIARGMAPVIVLVVSVTVLGVGSSVTQAAGVGLVGLGVVLVRGLRGGARWSHVASGPDRRSVHRRLHAGRQGRRQVRRPDHLRDADPHPAIDRPGGGGRVAGRGCADSCCAFTNGFCRGVASISAYGLVLIALTTAAAASVAAVREVSVVIAVALGAILLHERVGPSRAAGAVVVVAGVALIVLG